MCYHHSYVCFTQETYLHVLMFSMAEQYHRPSPFFEKIITKENTKRFEEREGARARNEANRAELYSTAGSIHRAICIH